MDELSAAYARVLESVWAMPIFSRQDSGYAALGSDASTKLVKRLGWPGLLIWPLGLPFRPVRGWWRSFLIRPVASFYVNMHVNSSSRKLSGVLNRQRLLNGAVSESENESLDRSIATVERLKSVTTDWIALLVLLRFVPLVGLLFSMGIVTVSYTLKDAPDLILQLIGILPLAVLMIHPLVVQFGFRWKRALFAGGGIDAEGMPRQNVYEIEQRAYQRLGVKRSTEFPVDLFLAPGYYFLINWMTGLLTESITFNEDASEPGQLFAAWVFVATFVVFTGMATVRLVLRYKLRRASGHY